MRNQNHHNSTKSGLPFGSPLIGRGFEADEKLGYKFGFNGKEKDDEINVDGGSYDFGARIYDGRLGRWLSLDPLFRNFPNLSAYSFAANSPILIIDKCGMTLELGGQVKKSTDDIKSIIENSDYRELIQVTTITKDGVDHQIVDFVDRTKVTKEMMDKDVGLWLINKLITSEKEYLYEATDATKYYDPKLKQEMDINTENNPDLVFSKTPKFYKDESLNNNINKRTDDNDGAPKNDLDGQVSIHPDTEPMHKEGNDWKADPRESLVLHALLEVMLRTEPLGKNQKDKSFPASFGLPYSDTKKNKDTDKKGAHGVAAAIESGKGKFKEFFKKAFTPGKLDGWKVNGKIHTNPSPK